MKTNALLINLLWGGWMLAMPAVAQGTTPFVSMMTVVYDYSINTLDHEGNPVTDEMKVMLQVGDKMTKSMPYSTAPETLWEIEDQERLATDLNMIVQEAMMHMPTVWTNGTDGMTTVREFIIPSDIEGYEPTPDMAWTLLDDTATISGYLCQKATTTFRGVEWQAWYTEEIPSSAGPWRLRGLPGLIVKAESKVHTFCLAELRQEEQPITMPEPNPNIMRMKYDKYLKHKNKIYGNKRYPEKPNYHIDLNVYVRGKTMVVFNARESNNVIINDRMVLDKSHVYQPLETK